MPPAGDAPAAPAAQSAAGGVGDPGAALPVLPGTADAMLPPSAAAGPVALSPQPLPAPQPAPIPATARPPEPAANPEFAVREPAKRVIRVGGEEIELRRLTPEEKAARRRKWTIVMALVGSTILIAALVGLTMFG